MAERVKIAGVRVLLMVCAGSSFTPLKTLDGETRGWIAEAEQRGLRVLGGRIQAPGEATLVTSAGERIEQRSGPRVDVDEQVIGFDVLEADDQETLLELVGRHPMAVYGTIEVRQLLDE